MFNASAVDHKGIRYIAFRAESMPGERPFRAYVATFAPGRGDELTDLTSAALAAGLPAKTADPKLVVLGDAVYVTFNTGNVHTGRNEVYLRRMAPTPGPFQPCGFSERRMVEKNWGFVLGHDGRLRALYALAPFTMLRNTSGRLGHDEPLQFEREDATSIPERFPRLHIGSQPLMISPDRALVVANQQLPIPGLPRKVYFGRLVEVDVARNRVVEVSPRLLIDSWRHALPPRVRHNPGLLSATYFAGMCREGDDFLVSYGINDVEVGLARVTERHLRGSRPR